MWPFNSSSAADGSDKKVDVATPTSSMPMKQPQAIKNVSRDEQAELDLQKLMQELSEEQTRATADQTARVLKSSKLKTQPTSIDISPDALYPTEMSCKQAFDYGMFCSAFGGQFVNVYRYGTWRSCSNHWSDFWLCMRTKGMGDEEAKKAIQTHYKIKAAKFKTGPSSEDIWEVRTEPVKDAFQENYEKLEEDIERWKTMNAPTLNPWASK